MPIARTRKHDELCNHDLVPNLGDHGFESIADTLLSQEVYVCFTLAFDVLRIEGVIGGIVRGTICELYDAPSDEATNIERDSPDRDCVIPVWKLSCELLTSREVVLTCLCLA